MEHKENSDEPHRFSLKNLELSLISDYQREKKDCPKCNKTIHKKGEQMYCYHCYTPFVWDTREIISFGINEYKQEPCDKNFSQFYININRENPLDFDIPRDINMLKRMYKKLFYIQDEILPKFKVNYIRYNKYIRNKLKNNEISLSQFSEEIEKKGREMTDKKEIYNILTNFLTTSFSMIYSFRKVFTETYDKWNTRWFTSKEYKTFVELLNKSQDTLDKEYNAYKVNIKNEEDYLY